MTAPDVFFISDRDMGADLGHGLLEKGKAKGLLALDHSIIMIEDQAWVLEHCAPPAHFCIIIAKEIQGRNQKYTLVIIERMCYNNDTNVRR